MGKKEDLLNGESFLSDMENLINIISHSKQSCCFALNGEWGSGKTFVLKSFGERVKSIQSEDTMDNKYFVFHYDCWKYDYYDEPAIAIISAMLDATDEELSLLGDCIDSKIKLGWNTVKKTLSGIAKELCKAK